MPTSYGQFGPLARHLRFVERSSRRLARQTFYGMSRWQAAMEQIERLPANQRAVLVLAKFEGLSYREIAAILSTTESAVESRLVRAMRTLTRAQGGALSTVSDKGVSR